MLDLRAILDGLVFPELREGGPLHGPGAAPLRITYRLHDGGAAGLTDHDRHVVSWARWTDAERTTVRTALEQLEAYINVDFVERRTGVADIPIGVVETYRETWLGGQTYYGFRYRGEDLVDFRASVSLASDPDVTTVYHELGHALGLKHPFEGRHRLPEAYDNLGYTIMSYDRRFDRDSLQFDLTPDAGQWRHFDILALQSIWGVASGQTVPGLADFGRAAGGWSSQAALPRRMADVDGDGAADIVGFGFNRVLVALADGAGGFAAPGGGVVAFATAQGWRDDDRTPRLLGDIDGDGDADIVGFGFRASFSALGRGDGGFAPMGAALDNFSQAQGWRDADSFPRRLADVDGDGRADIVAFGREATFVALSQGDGSFGPIRRASDNFTPADGWRSDDATPRLLGDVNGDGRADIVGFGNSKTFVALGRKDGTFRAPQEAIENFTGAQGWRSDDRTPRLLADVNGDGRADIVGFGIAVTYTALGTRAGRFEDVQILADDFVFADGWTSQDRLPRAVADADGDGLADIVGFSAAGVRVRQTVLQDWDVAGRAAAPLPHPHDHDHDHGHGFPDTGWDEIG